MVIVVHIYSLDYNHPFLTISLTDYADYIKHRIFLYKLTGELLF